MITQQNPTLCRMYGSKGETVAHEVSECGKLAQTENEGKHDNVARYIQCNFVVNVHWKEQIAGMNRSRGEYWKVKTSRYCKISQSSVIGKLRQEHQVLSLLMRRRERLS